MASIQARNSEYDSWSLPTISAINSPAAVGITRGGSELEALGTREETRKELEGFLAFLAAMGAFFFVGVLVRVICSDPAKPDASGTSNSEHRAKRGWCWVVLGGAGGGELCGVVPHVGGRVQTEGGNLEKVELENQPGV